MLIRILVSILTINFLSDVFQRYTVWGMTDASVIPQSLTDLDFKKDQLEENFQQKS